MFDHHFWDKKNFKEYPDITKIVTLSITQFARDRLLGRGHKVIVKDGKLVLRVMNSLAFGVVQHLKIHNIEAFEESPELFIPIKHFDCYTFPDRYTYLFTDVEQKGIEIPKCLPSTNDPMQSRWWWYKVDRESGVHDRNIRSIQYWEKEVLDDLRKQKGEVLYSFCNYSYAPEDIFNGDHNLIGFQGNKLYFVGPRKLEWEDKRRAELIYKALFLRER